METLFQKLPTQHSETFRKEPLKKSLPQDSSNWSPRTKIALAAITTISTLGAYLAFPKINIPNSRVSSPINSAFKIFGSLTALASLAGLFAYISNSTTQTNTHPNQKSNAKPDNSVNSAYFNIKNPFNKFHSGEKINQNLLEDIITKYNDQNTNSLEKNILSDNFISNINTLIQDYQTGFYKYNSSLDEKKSNLSKIIDILDVFIGRTDPLSCMLIENLFSDIIPDSLHAMTQMIDQEDTESKELVERSHQLVYKALAQQMEILPLSDIIDIETKLTVEKAFIRILELLTPFENDNFRLKPNFYSNFIQYSPKFAWPFVQKYIFEHMITNKLPSHIDLYPLNIITNFLNARDKNNGDKHSPRYTLKDGFEILSKIVIGAQLSLFLVDQDQGAASYAIRLMQYSRKIDPKEFEKKYPKDSETLIQLYFYFCKEKDFTRYEELVEKNVMSDEANHIAKTLAIEFYTFTVANILLGSDASKFRQTLINKIAPLLEKKEYSDTEIEEIQLLTSFIKTQILNPSAIPLRVELAVLALDQYAEVLLNKESVDMIRNAYSQVKVIGNTDLDSACQKFLKTCDTLNVFKPEKISGLDDLELTNDSIEEEMPDKQKGKCILF
jgi:hypothetical protein